MSHAVKKTHDVLSDVDTPYCHFSSVICHSYNGYF